MRRPNYLFCLLVDLLPLCVPLNAGVSVYDGLEEVDVWVRFVPRPGKNIIEAGLLTNLAVFAGANSSHKLVIGLQAALIELTDTIAVIVHYIQLVPKSELGGVDGWADLNPPGKLIAEVIKN